MGAGREERKAIGMTRRDLLWVLIRCMGLLLLYHWVGGVVMYVTVRQVPGFDGELNMLVPKILLDFCAGVYCTFGGQGLLAIVGAGPDEPQPDPDTAS